MTRGFTDTWFVPITSSQHSPQKTGLDLNETHVYITYSTVYAQYVAVASIRPVAASPSALVFIPIAVSGESILVF